MTQSVASLSNSILPAMPQQPQNARTEPLAPQKPANDPFRTDQASAVENTNAPATETNPSSESQGKEFKDVLNEQISESSQDESSPKAENKENQHTQITTLYITVELPRYERNQE